MSIQDRWIKVEKCGMCSLPFEIPLDDFSKSYGAMVTTWYVAPAHFITKTNDIIYPNEPVCQSLICNDCKESLQLDGDFMNIELIKWVHDVNLETNTYIAHDVKQFEKIPEEETINWVDKLLGSA